MTHQDSKKPAPGDIHRGPAHSAPYPVSRLGAPLTLVDLAREIEHAEQMLGVRTSAQLRVIADQVKALQAEAKKILEQARWEAELHHARCAFRKIPGRVYHLYRLDDDSLSFSMLSPADWRGRPPHAFVGSYLFGADSSWRPAEQADAGEDPRSLVNKLLDHEL